MNQNKQKEYLAPEAEVMTIEVEQGFNLSNPYDQNEDLGGEKEEGEW